MVDFAQRSGAAPPVGAKVWHAIDRTLTSQAETIDSSGYERMKAPSGEYYITSVSLSSLRGLLKPADSAATPNILSKGIRRMPLGQAFGRGFGPKLLEFIRHFVADIEANMDGSANPRS